MNQNDTIVINGRFLGRALTGVERYALETVNALDELLAAGDPLVAGRQWVVLVPPGVKAPQWKHVQVKTFGRGKGNLWEQVWLPLYSHRKMLLNLCNAAPLLKLRQTVVIHDATTKQVPQAFSAGFRAWYGLMIPWLLKTAQKVATVSRFSQGEIARTYGTTRKITVVPEGSDHFERVQADGGILDRHQLRARPYVLGVGSMAPHKNFATLVSAVRLLKAPNFDVVLAGGANPRVFGDASADLPAWIKHVGYVSEGELKALYQNAACFVFPSLYEGFGLPPIEAMALGCPVISSNTASPPEVCGDAAVYFDPHDAHALARTIDATLASDEKLRDLKQAGLARASLFTWKIATRHLLEEVFNTR